MDEIRLNRIASMMKDELSVLVNQGLKDPRIPSVTITDVILTRDAKQATVKVSILQIDQTTTDRELIEVCLEGLNSSKGYLRRELAAIMKLRYMPELIFKEDKGLENTLRVHEILKQLDAEKANRPKSEN